MLSLPVLVTLAALASLPQDSAGPRVLDCREWHDCRQRALEALAAGDYERFHDLAWRTVQTGPPRDPDLMYLLARAQSLSGRPHDALVMLGRLAEMGMASDAATNEDFRAVRGLREWPPLEALITSALASAPTATRLGSTSSGTAPVVPPSSFSQGAGTAATPTTGRSSPDQARLDRGAPAARGGIAARSLRAPNVLPPSRAQDALLLAGTALDPRGLAYDDVSGRFVVADRRDRKLVVIDERSHRVVDLVRSRSAGFYEITAFEIDSRRGDLWVVSADTQNADAAMPTSTALHKLQLVSGRPLVTFSVPEPLKPARFTDVAVTADGVVFVLDSAGKRIFRLQAEARAIVVVASLQADGLTSLAPADDNTLYVACATGIVRVEVSSGISTPLRGLSDIELTGFEHIRWNRGSLTGIQQAADGSHRAVNVRLVRGQAVALDVVEVDIPMTDPTAATLSGNDLYFLTRRAPKDGTETDIIVRRARLR